VKRTLDRDLQALKAAPADRALDQLEPAVWRRIEAARRVRTDAGVLSPAGVAAVAVAMAVGVAIGGTSASEALAERQEVAVFSVDARLAPSTLLEGHR
jgi:hypothetical protein